MNAIQLIADEVIISIALGVVSLFTAYTTYGVYKLTEKAKAQIAQINDETARWKLENALEDVDRLATVTVLSIEQTAAKVLRQAVKEGKVDRKELEALAVGAKKKIINAIKPEAQQIIAENLGSFDDYVGRLIEERVLELKSFTKEQEA